MRTYRMRALAMLTAVAVTLAGVAAVRADVASDRAAAILIFPRVLYTSFQGFSPLVIMERPAPFRSVVG